MSNLNILLKLASRSAALSFLALILVFGSSLLSSKASAAHISAFPKNAEQLQYQLKHINISQNHIALKAISKALKKVEDGGTYRWQHKNSNLAGLIKPTTTYVNGAGQLCRHIQFSLYAGTIKKQSQALACRNNKGLWIVKS